jgi:hypothetical protein
MSWSFDLPYTRPPFGLSANDRPKHWGPKATNTAEVRELVFYLTRTTHVPALEKCRVDVVWVVKDRRRRDTDNLAPLLKAIYDGIGSDRGVSARIVEDDAPEFMTKPGATIRYETGCTPHFEVTITDIGDEA